MGVGQRRFLCAQCVQPCGCLCGGCDVHDYTTDASSKAALCIELLSLRGSSMFNSVDLVGELHRGQFYIHDRSGALQPSFTMINTEWIPSPPPSPPIAGFTSVARHAPASSEAQAALHRHLSDGVPLLVSPPYTWSRRFLYGLSAKWVSFLERWDAAHGLKVVPSGFPDTPYNGFGEEWLTYWRMDTSWFVAAVKESDVNMVEKWVANCDSRQASMVGKVIRALGELVLPDRHDPARSLVHYTLSSPMLVRHQ